MHIEIICKPRTLEEAKEAEALMVALYGVLNLKGGTLSGPIREHTLTAGLGEPWYDRGLVLRAVGRLNRAGADVPLLKAAE